MTNSLLRLCKIDFQIAGRSARILHQATPAAKQAMCRHMADAAGCKGEDASAVETQQLLAYDA